MRKDLPLDAKLQLVRDGLQNGLKTIKAHNYAFVGERTFQTKLVPIPSYLFDFKHPEGSREITIHYVPASDRGGDFLSVLIKKSNSKEKFLLDDYFTAHKLIKKAESVRDVRRQTEEFSVWLSEKLGLFDSIFSRELRDILLGKTWEKVPIDWHGYK